MGLSDRLRHAWDAFRNRDPTRVNTIDLGPATSVQMDRTFLRYSSERTIIASIYTRIAVDVASIDIRHVKVDKNGRFTDEIDDSLNQCFKVSPNLDQTPQSFFQDAVLTMLEEGTVAIFPSEADLDPIATGSYQIQELRKGRITDWYPEQVAIEAWNPYTANFDRIIMPKKLVAIVQNPFYDVMNAQNSTLTRLKHKLALLDMVDNNANSKKLNLIVQLPYLVKSELKQQYAEKRRKDLEMQLTQSEHGIAYLDGTEKIVQLNRPVESNLLAQVEYLQNQLYAELGSTPEVFNGSANEEQNLNYTNRTILPIISRITSEMNRKFLTKTARTRGQAITFFRDPFKLVPVSQIAEIADKFTRNEILTSNEIRGIMGFKPSEDPKADELRNSNISASKQENEEMIAPDMNTDDAPMGGEGL